MRIHDLFIYLPQAVLLTLFLVSPALLEHTGGCPDCHHRSRRSLRFLRNIFDRFDRVLQKPVEVDYDNLLSGPAGMMMSWDCLGGGWRHQHRPVLIDSPEEDVHWGWYSKYLHKSLRSEMLLLHLPESHNNCGDGGTGGSGEQTGETSFGRGGWAEHRASSDFSLSALTLYREWRAWLDHFVRLIISATVISVFLLFLLIIASSSSVTEPWIRICLKNFY